MKSRRRARLADIVPPAGLDAVLPAEAVPVYGGAAPAASLKEALLDCDFLRTEPCVPVPARSLGVIVSLRTFLWVWNAMMCSLGPNRQTSATVALSVTDTQSVVSCTCTKAMHATTRFTSSWLREVINKKAQQPLREQGISFVRSLIQVLKCVLNDKNKMH